MTATLRRSPDPGAMPSRPSEETRFLVSLSLFGGAKNPYLAKAFHCRFELEDFDKRGSVPAGMTRGPERPTFARFARIT